VGQAPNLYSTKVEETSVMTTTVTETLHISAINTESITQFSTVALGDQVSTSDTSLEAPITQDTQREPSHEIMYFKEGS
jgi:hypothetical protein